MSGFYQTSKTRGPICPDFSTTPSADFGPFCPDKISPRHFRPTDFVRIVYQALKRYCRGSSGSQQTARTWLLADPRGNSWRARTRLQVQASSFKLQTPNVKLSEVWGRGGRLPLWSSVRPSAVRKFSFVRTQNPQPSWTSVAERG